MRNTLAIAVIILGTMMMISAVKNWKFITTLKVVIGQAPWDTPADGGGPDTSGGGISNPFDKKIPGRATANPKDRPGYKDEDLERNPDGTWKRDADGNIVLKPGAVPFDPQQAGVAQKNAVKGATDLSGNADTRRNIARF